MVKKPALNSSNSFKNNKSRKFKLIFLIIFILMIAAYGNYKYNKSKFIKDLSNIDKNNNNTRIKPQDVKNNKKLEEDYDNREHNKKNENNTKHDNGDNTIINIALFGIDTGREKNEAAHADAIIIATIDYKHKKIKLSSILRDTYVNVEGHNKTKINESYAFGGPKLAIKTLNQNFGVNINDYITVNFFTLEKIVDILGGIDVDINNNEINEMNKLINEIAKIENKESKLIIKAGKQNINGIQAVAYSRIRNVGNGDFERSKRQGIVLNQLLKKVQNTNSIQHANILLKLLPYLDTSMEKPYILKLASSIIKADISKIEQQRFPLDGYCKGQFIDGIWYLIAYPSVEVTRNQILDYIYNDKKPVPGKPLF